MNEVINLARWRFYLLRRQKLVLGALVLGCVGLILAFAVASASYMWPEKVYWDFALGLFFVCIIFLGIFEASSLFADERQRRTLHLLLASGISRRSWVWGNFLGLMATCLMLLLVWGGLGLCASWALPQTQIIDNTLLFQAQLVLALETMVVFSMAMAFSFYLRSVLALILSVTLTIFLHSQISLISVLTDSQTGAFNKPMLQPILQWLVPLLPPLEWFDLRVMVGYASSVSWLQILLLAIMALFWTIFWIELGLWKFHKTDL